MQITVNGETRDAPEGTTLTDLITQLQLVPERVAVEVNTRLVRRANFTATPLHAGDRIEIVTLVGGG